MEENSTRMEFKNGARCANAVGHSLAEADLFTRAEDPARFQGAERTQGQGRKRVLYVEDDQANVMFMRDLVSIFGNIELFASPTAEMGIELARATAPDAILMDIKLPGMNGLEALLILRAIPETKNIPVIALTSAAPKGARQQGLDAGFFRYMTKPVKVDELLGVLEEVLRHRN